MMNTPSNPRTPGGQWSGYHHSSLRLAVLSEGYEPSVTNVERLHRSAYGLTKDTKVTTRGMQENHEETDRGQWSGYHRSAYGLTEDCERILDRTVRGMREDWKVAQPLNVRNRGFTERSGVTHGKGKEKEECRQVLN